MPQQPDEPLPTDPDAKREISDLERAVEKLDLEEAGEVEGGFQLGQFQGGFQLGQFQGGQFQGGQTFQKGGGGVFG